MLSAKCSILHKWISASRLPKCTEHCAYMFPFLEVSFDYWFYYYNNKSFAIRKSHAQLHNSSLSENIFFYLMLNSFSGIKTPSTSKILIFSVLTKKMFQIYFTMEPWNWMQIKNLFTDRTPRFGHDEFCRCFRTAKIVIFVYFDLYDCSLDHHSTFILTNTRNKIAKMSVARVVNNQGPGDRMMAANAQRTEREKKKAKWEQQ